MSYVSDQLKSLSTLALAVMALITMGGRYEIRIPWLHSRRKDPIPELQMQITSLETSLSTAQGRIADLESVLENNIQDLIERRIVEEQEQLQEAIKRRLATRAA